MSVPKIAIQQLVQVFISLAAQSRSCSRDAIKKPGLYKCRGFFPGSADFFAAAAPHP